MTGVFLLASLVLASQEIAEFTEPAGPDIVTHAVEGRCGSRVYRVTFLTGPKLYKNYIAEISVDGVKVHDRELAKLGPVIQERFDLQSIRFGHCNPSGKPGLEFFVETYPRKPNSLQLESHRFELTGSIIVRKSR